MTSGWNEAQFGILFCEPVCFFFSSVVRSSCQDFSVIITDKNVFFRFLLIVIKNFLIFRLESLCFRSQVFGFKLFVVSVLLVSNWLVFSVSSFSVSGTEFFLG